MSRVDADEKQSNLGWADAEKRDLELVRRREGQP